MGKKLPHVVMYLLLWAPLIACGPSQAELDMQATTIAANIFATQTAEAPTPTPTLTPTPTSTPTATMPPVPQGWRGYKTNNFFIAMPERWKVIDLEKEGIEAIFDFVKKIDAEWARNISSMFTTEAMKDMIKMYAMDPEPAGPGYATFNITYESSPLPMTSDDLCVIIPSVYEQLGLELDEVKCNLRINNLDVAQFRIHVQLGPITIVQYQYIYLQNNGRWTLTLAVDKTEVLEYEPIFISIAESFRID